MELTNEHRIEIIDGIIDLLKKEKIDLLVSKQMGEARKPVKNYRSHQMTISAKELASRLLRLAHDEKVGVSQLKLMKLCYFAHAWNLSINKNPLIDEQIEAWMHGPVIRSLCNTFRRR